MTSEPHVLYVVTSALTARVLLRGQLGYLRRAGFRVSLICGPGNGLDEVARREDVEVLPVRMQREIAPLSDLLALLGLWRRIRALRPDLINASTTKAGLLGMVAGRLAGVRQRIYLLRGLRLETTSGPRRALLRLTERLAAGCATQVIAVSSSLAALYVGLGLAAPTKVSVLGHGSSNGVDLDRFKRPQRTPRDRNLRDQLGLATDEPIIGFVGRLTRDKGVDDLLASFDRLRQRLPRARLLLVGGFESGDPVSERARRRIEADPAISSVGLVSEIAPYYALMDVLAFPSYREGFPNAPLEAAASGLPTVGYRATGTVDVIEDGSTGRLVDPGDVMALADGLHEYLVDPELRQRHGRSAADRASRLFAQEQVWESYVREYHSLLRRDAGDATRSSR